MARMLSQLPLPLLPDGAAEIAPGVGFAAGDEGGLVIVHGLATFAWDAGDEAGRRLAAVQLVRLRAASQGQVAGAFGVDPATIWRWDQALAADGVAGLVQARRGPKGASKLTPQLVERIAAAAAGPAPASAPRCRTARMQPRSAPGAGLGCRDPPHLAVSTLTTWSPFRCPRPRRIRSIATLATAKPGRSSCEAYSAPAASMPRAGLPPSPSASWW